jgi:DNA-directed RNA polymerase specialized sigma24 family protein
MTSAERSGDHNEAVSYFLKLHGQELELQAIKLARCYSIDLHELISRTSVTVWEKWPSDLCALPNDECYKRALCILYNHARNLSKIENRSKRKCYIISGEELDNLTQKITARQDLVALEAAFKDEQFAIYKAISLLDGRCRDVMTLIALGLENNEIRQELGMTVTNLTSTKARARKLLREILGFGDKDEGGEPQ